MLERLLVTSNATFWPKKGLPRRTFFWPSDHGKSELMRS
jgi:hypothetical protein